MRNFTAAAFLIIATSGYCGAQESCSQKDSSCGVTSVQGTADVLPPMTQNLAGAPPQTQNSKTEIALFYAYDCPHCHKAIKWLATVSLRYPDIVISKYEIKRDKQNRTLFARYLSAHKAAPAGVPTFEGQTENEITAVLDGLAGKTDCSCKAGKEITVPFIGSVNPSSVSMLEFSLLIGLLDGLNPCAIWVLIFLMGLLIHTHSTKKMLFVGGIFVGASALVYFAFMATWFNFFIVIGYSRWITLALGAAAAIMGVINIKEVFFFKKGVSLMIPESAKPKLAEKIRRIINEKETAAAVAGTILLALFVNLIELGCTIGLPAIFTRVLSVRKAGFWEKYYYMGVYNIAYIVPLAMIVAVFVFTMGRYTMTEAHAKTLKAISGILMLLLGLLMVFKPEALVK
ncbi:MAG: hypothetical protein NTW04_04870 [Elusimicrobia bacterium]|nr:hypothetical protein [Elusimicrobiota bacterium]